MPPADRPRIEASALWEEARSNLGGVWPSLVAILFVAYFDLRTNGQWLVTFGFVLLVSAPILLQSTVAPLVRRRSAEVTSRLSAHVDPKYANLVLGAIPVGIFYVIRLRGTQSVLLAVVTMGVPIGALFALRASRPLVHRRLASWYHWRDQVLPMSARMGLLIGIPLLLAFFFVHSGNIADLASLFGAQTQTSTLPEDATLRIILVAGISAVFAFLLLDQAADDQ